MTKHRRLSMHKLAHRNASTTQPSHGLLRSIKSAMTKTLTLGALLLVAACQTCPPVPVAGVFRLPEEIMSSRGEAQYLLPPELQSKD